MFVEPNDVTEDAPVLPEEILASLRRLGLLEAGEPIRAEALAGGVSSEIWRVDRAGGPIAVKRALSRLRVAQEWLAPVERSAHEAAWLLMVAEMLPQAAPSLLGFDAPSGTLAMTYLEPQLYPSWKQQLLRGHVDKAVAAEAGRRIGILHARTTNDERWRPAFDDPAMFAMIRLDPYFAATAARHPDRAKQIGIVRAAVEGHAEAVIHGDVSPKNMHTGPDGPVLLDAECATWGDPAFDLAFPLTHLFLKALVVPAHADHLRQAADALANAYLEQVQWEDPSDLALRAARILTVLILARVDGKSPVEYLSDHHRADVRRYARAQLMREHDSLPELSQTWIGF